MKIDQATMGRLLDVVKASKETDEVEARYTAPMSYDKFDSVVRYLRAHGRNFMETEMIDVVVQLDGKSYRATASGPVDVQAVMAAVSSRSALDPAHRKGIVCIMKSLADSVNVSQYDMKFTRKHEVPVTQKSTLAHIAERMGSNTRHVRAKRRFSCTTEDGACRFDITAVNHISLSSSTQQTADVRYEAEVELVDRSMEPIKCILSMFRAFSIILKIVNDTDHVLSADERQSVISRYSALAKAGGRFIGPQPVTLELRHLAEPSPGSDSVRVDYTITDKADGDRSLAYIDASGTVFLIDNRLNTRGTGLTCKGLADTLLDCEVVKAANRKLILIFDIYFYSGKDVSGLPLTLGLAESAEDRLSYMKRIVQTEFLKSKDTDADVLLKEFRLVQFGGEDMMNQVRYLVRKKDAGNVPYETDGLIFTPSKLAVGAALASGAPSLSGGRWDKVFKWKPPEFNSIDFLIRFPDNGDIVIKKGPDGQDVLYRCAKLYVGTKASEKPVSLLDYTRFLHKVATGDKGTDRFDKNDAMAYVPRLFEATNTNTLHMALLEISDGGLCRAVNGDVINDNTIVEMTYGCSRDQEHAPECWKALRVRRDKTDRYILTNSISNAANDINTALSVWRSICFPITQDMLTGVAKISEGDLKAAVDAASGGFYYMRNRPREQSASLPMLIFHNYWVKRESLIIKFKGHALSLFDFGCGRGGDIPKWVDAAFIRVLGIDPVDDNLTNPGPLNEGACSRAMSRNKAQNNGRFPKLVFLRMDAATVINQEYIEELAKSDPETSAIAKSLWALEEVTGMPPDLRSLHGFAAQGFDLASCMMAAHYFFDRMDRLRSFAINVANQLRAGGHFFGTCLDGHRVSTALSGLKLGQSIEGRKDGRLLWNITKLYEDTVVPEENKKRRKKVGGGGITDQDPRIGKKIRVFVETIGQPLDEYLMDFSLLKEVMAEKGIFPMAPAEAVKLGFNTADGFFDDLYREMASKNLNSANPNIKVALQMSDAEKEYSFMHRWFVFTKR